MCNCNGMGLYHQAEDTGTITNSSRLPVLQLKFGQLLPSSKSNFGLSSLRCEGSNPDKILPKNVHVWFAKTYDKYGQITKEKLSNDAYKIDEDKFLIPITGSYMFSVSALNCAPLQGWGCNICLFNTLDGLDHEKFCLSLKVKSRVQIIDLVKGDHVWINKSSVGYYDSYYKDYDNGNAPIDFYGIYMNQE